jgi:malate dehydrogenase
MPAPIRVAITGAAGNIGYSLIWRIASGDCFGPDQPVILSLLEVTPAMGRLEGVVMELVDSANDLVVGVETSDSADVAFNGVSAAFLVGSRPRGPGMSRADLVAANGPIFVGQGRALNRAASDVKIVTVGNPCNTNCLIAQHAAGDVPAERFTAMTRLDQNRAHGQIALKYGVPWAKVQDVVIWGNHGPTMYPDVTWAKVKGEQIGSTIDQEWVRGEFMNTVAKRGEAIIAARGASSAASAANAAVDHMRDWHLGSNNRLVAMAVVSKGEYGVPAGLVYSMPVRCHGGEYQVMEGFEVDAFARTKITENIDALQAERQAVSDLLG